MDEQGDDNPVLPQTRPTYATIPLQTEDKADTADEADTADTADTADPQQVKQTQQTQQTHSRPTADPQQTHSRPTADTVSTAGDNSSSVDTTSDLVQDELQCGTGRAPGASQISGGPVLGITKVETKVWKRQ